MAAGSLDPIRTILSARTKTFQASFLEALNPVVISLYDDVDIATILPVDPATAVTYTLPEEPTDNRYTWVFYTVDGDRRIWNFCPNGKVTARGDDQSQQGDVTSLQMTITLYPDMIGSASARPCRRPSTTAQLTSARTPRRAHHGRCCCREDHRRARPGRRR